MQSMQCDFFSQHPNTNPRMKYRFGSMQSSQWCFKKQNAECMLYQMQPALINETAE